MYSPIPYDLKRRCVEAWTSGKSSHDIYDELFRPEHPDMTYPTFRVKLQRWKKKAMADEATEISGTYPGMVAHAATVQVDGKGNITQAWIKQTAGVSMDDMLAAIRETVEPVQLPPCETPGETMLEIPIFDAHFGVATLADYEHHLAEIVATIKSKHWAEIHIIIGQDCLHTNDMRGHTAKGTDIGRVDFAAAWRDAWAFWCTILDVAIENSPHVFAHFSKGNHDETAGWCFFKALEARYVDATFDDNQEPRKAFTWEGVFVGYGHVEYANKIDKIFRDFVLDFPIAFAGATCREIHTGHLHHETVDNGMVVRRLASAVPADEWSRNHGFFGVHKRFQLFEYSPGRLRSIIYI